MATVYLADDPKHERKAALKVLKPELAAVAGTERGFLFHVQGDRPVIAHFGIALAVYAGGGARLTETGLSLPRRRAVPHDPRQSRRHTRTDRREELRRRVKAARPELRATQGASASNAGSTTPSNCPRAGIRSRSTRSTLIDTQSEPQSMNAERRYTEDEISEILDRATEAQTDRSQTSAGATGLTLRELHEIGREVGIPDEVITRAATSLDQPRTEAVAQETFLGQTIGVGRTVHLTRPLADEEWHRLVIDLRETFNAKGKISDEGAFRQWTNSNLHALLEPAEGGERLRLRTLKGNARFFQGMGATFMAIGGGMGIASLLGLAGDPKDLVFMGVMGAVFFLSSRLTVPSWAQTRTRQFEEVISRLTHSISAAPDGSDSLAPGPEADEGD
jgi:hypothetical protein